MGPHEKTASIFLFGLGVGAVLAIGLVEQSAVPPQSPFDADGDGVINEREFRAAAASLLSLADANGDGTLDAAEIKAAGAFRPGLAHAVETTFAGGRSLEELFPSSDKDGDNVLQRGEAGSALDGFLFPE